MNYIRYQPLSLVRELQQELFPLFCLKENVEQPLKAAGWSLEVDVKIQDHKLLIVADVPGVEAKDIQIEVKDNTLTIEGERKEEVVDKQPNYYKAERRSGRFLRQIVLPITVDETKIVAKMKNGVLTIELPPLEEDKHSRRISIEEE